MTSWPNTNAAWPKAPPLEVDMPVKMVDLSKLLAPHRPALLKAAESVMISGQFIQGHYVEKLQCVLAEQLDVPHVIAVSSGTDALLACLMALDIGPQDLVLTSPYSFIATASTIVRVGAKPVFIDIDPRTFNLSPIALRNWFDNHEAEISRVKAIIPVHLFGQCADMNAIGQIGNQYNVPIIEDAAQALNAMYPSTEGAKAAGTLGQLGCFSFFATKNLGALGEGGFVATHDPKLARRIRQLRNHGRDSDGLYQYVGGNFRMEEIQAAFLIELLPCLELWNKKRKTHASIYDKILPNHRPIRLFGENSHVYHHYVIRVSEEREPLRQRLHSKGIETAVYYPRPIHKQPCMSAHAPQRPLHEAERAASTSLALPIHPGLQSSEIQWVASQVATELMHQDSI